MPSLYVIWWETATLLHKTSIIMQQISPKCRALKAQIFTTSRFLTVSLGEWSSLGVSYGTIVSRDSINSSLGWTGELTSKMASLWGFWLEASSTHACRDASVAYHTDRGTNVYWSRPGVWEFSTIKAGRSFNIKTSWSPSTGFFVRLFTEWDSLKQWLRQSIL